MDEELMQEQAQAVVEELRKRGACTTLALAEMVGLEKSTQLNPLLSLLLRENVVTRVNDFPPIWALSPTFPMSSFSTSAPAARVAPSIRATAHTFQQADYSTLQLPGGNNGRYGATSTRMRQRQHVQYQPPPPYNPNPYSPTSATSYVNLLVSASDSFRLLHFPIPSEPSAYEQATLGVKRSSDDGVLHINLFRGQEVVSFHCSCTIIQAPWPDSGGIVAFYPKRPGEKLCAFYMTTQTCSFGLACKYDHPVWVPSGGIPNWKEVTGSANYAPTTTNPANLAQGEQYCALHVHTGEGKYIPRYMFNHDRKERQTGVLDSTSQNKDTVQGVQKGPIPGSDAVSNTAPPASSFTRGAISGTHSVTEKVPMPRVHAPGKATFANSMGLPVRQNEKDCAHYIKTGSCKFGAICRFNHPEFIGSGARPVLPTTPAHDTLPMMPTTPYINAYTNAQEIKSVANLLLAKVEENGMRTMSSVHPQRLGASLCLHFIKTGECSFGAACKFDHPPNSQPSVSKAGPTLTLSGLPRREGVSICIYYMKTGTCKYRCWCKFDHPPPEEIAAKIAAEATRIEGPPASEVNEDRQTPELPMQAPLWPWLSES